MDLYDIRNALRIKSIYDLPLRVTYYARVSSDSDVQLNSLDNQVSYYTELIKSKQNWTFVPGYVDEGISGASAKKRDDFQRMVSDAKQGEFDLVITKEITRFARNTLDSIMYTRELLSAGVGVLFENDGINTFDDDSELRLTIMSGIAQDELRKLSSRVKFGHQQAIKKGVVLGNSRIFGYRKDSGRLVIDEEEAPMVRLLFELYGSGDYSMKELETLFWEKGFRNHNGNQIAHTTMSGIISNPKYKGFYAGNKVKVVDLFTKKQKFLPEEEWVMYKDETGQIVPAIVSEDLWEQANSVLRKRSEDVKNRQGICNHANLLTGKMFCSHCGAPFYRRESTDKNGNKNSKWVCSGKIKNGASSCPSFAIFENEIKPIIADVFGATEAQIFQWIEDYLELYRSTTEGHPLQKEIDAITVKQEVIEKKKQKLLTYNVSGKISDTDFLRMNDQLTQELDSLTDELNDLIIENQSKKSGSTALKEIRKTLLSAAKDVKEGIVTKAFVDQYIQKIDVTISEDGSTASLDFHLFTGSVSKRGLSASGRLSRGANAIPEVGFSDVSMGHMSKKMIESYEKSM